MATETATATRTEYRLEHLPVEEYHPEVNLAKIVELLNDLGRQGWRVAAVDLSTEPEHKPAGAPETTLPVLLERPVDWKRCIEYRIERIPFQDLPEPHWEELMGRLAELERDGWVVMSVDLTYHPAHYKPGNPWALYGLESKFAVPVDTDLVKEAEVEVKPDPVSVLLGREV